MSKDTETSKGKWHEAIKRLELFLNVINQMCIGFVTIYISWLYLRTGLAGKGLHAWLVTIGFTLFMSEAIMCHYNQNVFTLHFSRNTRTILHWVLQILGCSIGLTGALIQGVRDKFVLFNTHAKLGLAAFIICWLSLLSGLTSLFSKSLRRFLSPLLNKTFHNFIGISTYAVAMCAQFYGYKNHIFKNYAPSEDFIILMQCITLVTLVLTSVGPLKALIYRFRNIISNYCM